MTLEKLNIFGASGYIGGNFMKQFPNRCLDQERDNRIPKSENILYFISTVDNYNIFKDITLDVETNLKILCEVLDNCRGGKFTINFISSWFVYGETAMPAKENSLCYPKGFYSITKKAAEDLLISFCKTYKQNYRIIRLCNVVGNSDKGASAKKNAITHMIDLLKSDKEITLYDNGTPTRDILHVIDICNAIEVICTKGNLNEVFNIGRGESTPIGYILNKAKKILGSNSNIKFVDAPEFHKIVQTKHFSMDVSKLSQLGFSPRYNIDEIIKELCL